MELPPSSSLHPSLVALCFPPRSLLLPYIFSHLISRTANKFHLFQPLYLFIYQPLRAVKNPWDTPHYKASSVSGRFGFKSLVNHADGRDRVMAMALHMPWLRKRRRQIRLTFAFVRQLKKISHLRWREEKKPRARCAHLSRPIRRSAAASRQILPRGVRADEHTCFPGATGHVRPRGPVDNLPPLTAPAVAASDVT